MQRRLLLSGFAAVALSACGFRLRGSDERAMLPFRTVSVAGPGAVTVQLRRMIDAGNSTRVLEDPQAAEAIIEILSESRDRGSVTLNTQGRIREYTIYYRVLFRVRAPGGATLLEPTEIVLKRDLSYNESQANAKEREEDMLFRNMQSDAVQQILRRLSALS